MPTPTTPTCSKCGYELTGLGVDDNCPECGTARSSPQSEQPLSGFAVASQFTGGLAILLALVGIVLTHTGTGASAVIVVFAFGIAILMALVGIVTGHTARAQVRRGIRGGRTARLAITGLIQSYLAVILGLAPPILVVLAIFIISNTRGP